MGSLTDACPKPMLEVQGKPLLHYKFVALPDEIDEVIIVVSYFGHIVQQYFGGEYMGKRVLYVEQDSPTGGTANALMQAQTILKDSFLVMNGDNLYARADMEAAMRAPDWAVVVKEVEHIATGRVIVENGLVTSIAENAAGARGYANIALYKLDMRIFDYKPVPKAEGSTELGLPQTMMTAVGDIPIHAIDATFWFEVKSPETLMQAAAVIDKI